jgi:mono/diheme cytochrome c family protein
MKRSRNQKLKPAAAMFSCFIVFFFLLVVTIDAKAQNNKWIAPKVADNLKNPLAGNTDVLKEGKSLYISYCTPCHGEKGKGDGVAAASLSTKPADHSSAYVQGQTDGALFWMITEGHNPMPTYKQALPENQRWELVNYIRTLAKTSKKS